MHHILIIEDEEPLRQTLAERLTMEGFRVTTAADGEAGLSRIKEEPPDLILCDIMMPRLDGYGVLRALQLDPQTAAIPFIFLTAKTDPPQVRDGMELGADDYLCKPVAKANLLAAIRTRLWKREQQQEVVEHEVEVARQDVMRKLPHELLSPLMSLLSGSQLLESADHTMSIAAIRELGRSMRLSAQRLHRMIRRFLLHAELQAAGHHPEAQAKLRGTSHISATALTSALAEHLARHDSRTDDLRLHLIDVEVVMDLTHFCELVAQLVDNAFKFSPPGSVVQIDLVLLPNAGCVLTVRDQGRGMTPDQIRQVGAFRQFDSDVWAQPGTGLGLALVRQLVALYCGSLELTSDPGNGTKAVVRLPNARPGAGGASALDPELQRRVARALGNW
jgi:DNA-binding response OmpR family regulator/two-component sensor histidine kinase